MSCVFCKIAHGEAPAHVVWQDDLFLAFLDVRPINPGHLLLIPRRHVDYLFDLDDSLYGPLFARAKELADPLRRATGCGRVGIAIEGYGVPHAHIHLVPINGPLELDPNRAAARAQEEQAEMAARIRELLPRVTGD
jgi:histidine triad (HIT) family protein